LIRTIARKGFRFVGDIQEKQTSEDGASAKSPLRTAQMATPPLLLPDKPSIAVLPFQNLSSDLEQEYFAEGVVEDIISALSRKRWLFVIARNSSFTYKGRTVDVNRWDANLACAMSSKAACASRRTGCASQGSLSTRLREFTCRQNAPAFAVRHPVCIHPSCISCSLQWPALSRA
jgi:hypothetical protein